MMGERPDDDWGDDEDEDPEDTAREIYYWEHVIIDDKGLIVNEPDMSKFKYQEVT